MIHGMVDRPLLLTMQDIQRFPSVSRIHFIRMPGEWRHGVASRPAQFAAVHPRHDRLCEWTGVTLATLLNEVGLQKGAAWRWWRGRRRTHGAQPAGGKCLDDCVVPGAERRGAASEQGFRCG